MENKRLKLSEERQKALNGGGAERLSKQHSLGKLGARERLEILLDAGSFSEIGMFVQHRAVGFGLENKKYSGDGVITGWGTIEGRPVYVFAQDFTVLGGSVGEAHAQKIARVMDLAIRNGAPLIGINDSGGARIQEGVDSLAGYGDIFYRNVQASGVIPQISVILGPCAGGAVYSPAITDFIFMSQKNACMFITGPQVVKAVTHEEIEAQDLGGASVHCSKSGVAHLSASEEADLLEQVRRLLSFLPANNLTPAPYKAPLDDPQRLTPELEEIVPLEPNQPYDIHQVIRTLLDEGDFFEIQEDFARNLVIGFGRLDGYPLGVIANQPEVLAGVLDIDASDKGARFIRFCDAYHIPLLTLVDTPGFLPGSGQEHGGVIRHGAKMIYAYAEASSPKISLVLRKAYGGAYIVMSSKHLGGDINLGWPQSEIAVMGPEGAVNIVFRKELSEAEDAEQEKQKLVRAYREDLATPFVAASRGYLDDIIEPAESRRCLAQALLSLQNKRQQTPVRKHGNIPL